MTAEARKQQILQVALKTIGEYGVQGATISRIAKGAGITTAALYTHFENRQAILLAALDVVYDKIFETHRSSSSTDAVQRLREMCEYHAKVIADQEKMGHAHLFLEFVAAAAEDGLREALREKELASMSDLASLVEECKQQGTLAQDVDSKMVAWLIAGWAWTGDVAHSMGVGETWHEQVSPHLLDLILESVSVESRGITRTESSAAVPVAQWTNRADQDPRAAALDETDFDGLPDGAVFTVEEVAEILRVSTGTVYDMVRRRQISSLNLGRAIRIPRRALVAYLRGMGADEFDNLVTKKTAVRQGV